MKNFKRVLIVVLVLSLVVLLNACTKKEYVYSFESQTFVYDGSEKIIEVKGELPKGATVEYKDNAKTEVGKYYSEAKVLGKNGNEIDCLRAILVIDNPKDEAFEKYMDELLVLIFEDDQMSVNFFFKNPENYGIPHYDAELTTLTFDTPYEEDMADVYEVLDKLEEFDYDNLNNEEKDTYDIVKRYFTYLSKVTEDMCFMTNDYLGSYLGYQANLPLELCEYKFRNEQDIKDFIAYLESAPDAFESYYEFSVLQAEKGYGMQTYVIDNVISQCEEFVNIKDDNYITRIACEMVDAVDFIDASKKAEYKAQIEAGVKGPLTDAYQFILDNLPNLDGLAKVDGGLAKIAGEEGKKYYELKLNDAIGYTNMTGEEAIAYVEAKFKEYNDLCDEIVKEFRKWSSSDPNYTAFINAVNDGNPPFSKLSAEEQLAVFREAAKALVPEIEEMPEITVKLVDESLQENFSPACYFVSPIDETNKESIYLNPKYTEDYNYIFTTLAHEGYPGHLYQNVFSKSLDINDVRKVLRCTGYMEGWATYVELESYGFVTNYNSKGLQLALEYNRASDILNGLLGLRFDLGIHYEGWSLSKMVNWTNDALGRTDTADELQKGDLIDAYRQMVEIPTNYAEYFLSYIIIEDMRNEAEETLGEYFDIVDFNREFLSYGAMPLEMLGEKIDEYIKDQCWIHNIQK